MNVAEWIQNWLGQVLLPVTGIGILALLIRALLLRSNAAKRAMVGYAALTAMTLALLTPWLPRLVTVSPETTAPIIRMRDIVIQGAEKAFTPGPSVTALSTTQVNPVVFLWWLYLAVALVMTTRLAIGLLKVARIRQSAERSSVSNEFPAYFHVDITVPVAFDGMKRCVILPLAAKNWSPEMMASVVRHEEAHLRHRDGLWLLLSQVLCIAFWFNPVIWLVNRRFRRDIEFLADDEVVLSGIVATTYAQDMLEAAKHARRIPYVAATAFATKASLKHRIASVLSDKKDREKVGMQKLGTAIVVASIATLGIVGWQNGPGQKVANPASWAPDVRDGLTTPASLTNGFVGVLKDGRKVELVQITQRVGGVLLAWRPDGSPIQPKNVIPIGKPSRPDDRMRFLLLRIERAKNTTEMDAGLGSGGSGADEPEWTSFSGGWMLKDDGGPYRYAVSIIEIKETGGSTGYFTFSVSDAPWNLEGKINPNKPFNSSFGSIEDFQIKMVVEPKDKLRESWARNNPGPWQMLTWTSKKGREMDSTKQVALVNSHSVEGYVEKEPEGSYGGYEEGRLSSRYYLSGHISNVKEIRFFSRTSQSVEVNGVKLSPN